MRIDIRLAACALLCALVPALIPAAHAATGFDVETATQAYLATLGGAARARSDAYFEGGYWITLWSALIAIAVDLVQLRTGLSARYRDWAERVTGRKFLQAMLYALPYVLVGALISAPWTIYTGFIREGQYGLMNQSFGGWLGDAFINLAIAMLLTAIVLGFLMMGLRRSPRRWWLWGTGFTAAFLALMMLVAPVFIAPLFNSYTELKPGPVRDRIVAMAAANHVPAEHIYVFDQSRQDKRISANVSGLGPTIRISLNDNLLNRTSLPETAAVMGHELGHYVLGHIWRLVAFFSLLIGFTLWIASRLVGGLIARFGARWGVRGPDDLAAVPVYVMTITGLMLLLTPVLNTITRTEESEADAFGLDAAREPDGFAAVAMKLSEYRKIEPTPLEEMLFYDHPSGATRVRMAMQWKKDHVPDAHMVTPPPLPHD